MSAYISVLSCYVSSEQFKFLNFLGKYAQFLWWILIQ